MSIRAKWILILIAAGFGISTYLTVIAHHPSSVVCSIGGSCETVLSSKYATLFGWPTSAWGMIWYGTGFILTYLTFATRRYPWYYFLTWSIAGLFFSLYLLSLETFKIHAYCTWCLSSLLIVTIIFVLTLTAKKDVVVSEFPNEQRQ